MYLPDQIVSVPSLWERIDLWEVTHKKQHFQVLFLNRPSSDSYWLILVFSNKRYKFYNKLMWKMSIQYPALEFESTTFWLWLSSLNL